ncbi:hypothetical protein BUALT_Bualt17G0063000 [Buddleja alternifolia]|uniref:DUF4005 domain-containing protein n=1 Tax=Buddleja alternifolia TaxID=168488 RepID=A0AAV6WH66_9LAMI|nr:hypothetical protein BUALT_Bualt17G0063000 [Buddleja alternifolia]
MGKSPGKWIKGIFGKKTSKLNMCKGRELSRSASEKPARASSKEPISTLIQEDPIISSPLPVAVVDRIDNSGFEKGKAEKLASDGVLSSSAKQDEDILPVSDIGLPNETEKLKLDRAATVVQASFRSHQARCAFQTLKGIIRLQAFVRGRLVRRQAITTLFCVQGIVKFQAIARGHLVRQSSIGNEQWKRQSFIVKDAKQQDSCDISKYSPADTLLKNAFINELLSSSSTALPLRLQYDPGEPNSAWAWLLRWSISQVWTHNSRKKKIYDSKHQMVETEETKPKRNGRVRSASLENGHNRAMSEKEKLKNNGKKLPIQPVKSAEIDVEKPKRYPKKLSKAPSPNTPSDKPMEGLAEAVLNSNLAFEEQSKLISEKSEENFAVEKDFKDDLISSESYKSSRRISLPAKHDDQEATPENAIRVPSYMAKTASSKAKVKAQVSPRLGLDHAADKNGLTRRYSLPSSSNGKLSSSPRVHRLVQANAREGIKIDRSLSSSRDITGKTKTMHIFLYGQLVSLFFYFEYLGV